MKNVVEVDRERPGEKIKSDTLLVEYVQRYRPLIQRLCRALLGDAGDSEDAVQQTFLLAYQSLLSGTRPRQPRQWLCTIARRECWARTHRRRHEQAFSPEETPSPELDPSEQAALRAELATITSELERLPIRQRQVIVLHELAGLSYSQLAAMLEISESAAEGLLVRARRRLRRARMILVFLPFPRSFRGVFERSFRFARRHGNTHGFIAAPVAKAAAVATMAALATAVGGAEARVDRATLPPEVPAVIASPVPQPGATAARRSDSVHSWRQLGRREVVITPASNGRAFVVGGGPAGTSSLGGTTNESGRHTASFAATTLARPRSRQPGSIAGADRHPDTTRAPHRPVIAGSDPPAPAETPPIMPNPPDSGATGPQPTTTTPAPPATDPLANDQPAEEPPGTTDPQPTDIPGGTPPANDPGTPETTGPGRDRGTVNGTTPGADPDPPAAHPDPQDGKKDPSSAHPDHPAKP